MTRLPNKDFYDFDLYADLSDQTWMEAVAGQQHTTVVVIKEATPTTLALLEKILGAVKQDLNKDCLVIQQKETIAFKDLLQVVPVNRLLVFGWTATDLGLHLTLPRYQLATFGGVQLLFSHDLAAIAANEHQEKQKLWGQLQQLFK